MNQRRVGTTEWRENFEGKCWKDQMDEDIGQVGCPQCGTGLQEEDVCPFCALHEQEEKMP